MARLTLKRMLLGIVIAVAVGVASIGALAFRAYHEATKIDRKYPEAVVGEFVTAYLADRDDVRAHLYTCREPKIDSLATLRDELRREEAVSGLRTQIEFGNTSTSDGGQRVSRQILLSQGAGVEVRTRVQLWRFTMVDEDGWRVCGAEQLPDPTPSASSTPTAATPPTAG